MRQKVVDVIFDALELGASLYDWLRKLRRNPAPEAHPLSYKDVQHQQEQIRQATMRQPPTPKR